MSSAKDTTRFKKAKTKPGQTEFPRLNKAPLEPVLFLFDLLTL